MTTEPSDEQYTYEPSREGEAIVRHFPDDWYSVRAWVREYDLQFEVFEMSGQDPFSWPERGASGGPTFCDDLDKSERCLTGYVKWDGCSNWDMSPDDGTMRHYCSKRQAVALGTMLGTCYDMAEELLTNYQG